MGLLAKNVGASNVSVYMVVTFVRYAIKGACVRDQYFMSNLTHRIFASVFGLLLNSRTDPRGRYVPRSAACWTIYK